MASDEYMICIDKLSNMLRDPYTVLSKQEDLDKVKKDTKPFQTKVTIQNKGNTDVWVNDYMIESDNLDAAAMVKWVFDDDNIFNKCSCGVDSIGGGKHSDWCGK